jgi:hypothetical protein
MALPRGNGTGHDSNENDENDEAAETPSRS